MNACLAFLREEDGPTSVEYAVMLACILTVIITAITTVGFSTGSLYTSSSGQMAEFGLGR